jgi:hypothetical protein
MPHPLANMYPMLGRNSRMPLAAPQPPSQQDPPQSEPVAPPQPDDKLEQLDFNFDGFFDESEFDK